MTQTEKHNIVTKTMKQTELKCLRQKSLFLAGTGSDGKNETTRCEKAREYEMLVGKTIIARSTIVILDLSVLALLEGVNLTCFTRQIAFLRFYIPIFSNIMTWNFPGH